MYPLQYVPSLTFFRLRTVCVYFLDPNVRNCVRKKIYLFYKYSGKYLQTCDIYVVPPITINYWHVCIKGIFLNHSGKIRSKLGYCKKFTNGNYVLFKN